MKKLLLLGVVLGLGAIATLFLWIALGADEEADSTTLEVVAAVGFYGCLLALAVLVVAGIVAGIVKVLRKRDARP